MASNTLLDWIFGPSAEEIRLKRAERQLAAVKQEFSTYRSNEDQRRRASARSNAKTRRQLNIAQKALIADHGKLNTERRKLDEELDQLARKQGHIDTQRRQLEQEKHALAVIQRGPTLTPTIPTNADVKAASDAIRARAFSGQQCGYNYVIRFFLDPQRSGLIVFEWELHRSPQVIETFVAYRDGGLIYQQTGASRGDFHDQFVDPNKRHLYRFALLDNDNKPYDEVIRMLMIPRFSMAQKPDSKGGPPEIEVWRQKQYAEAERYLSDPQQLKARKAQIDAAALEKFGEV